MINPLPLSEELDAEVTKRAKMLMEPGCDYWPFNVDNFCEALVESNPAVLAVVINNLLAGERTAVCEHLKAIAHDYWLKYLKELLVSETAEQLERKRADEAHRHQFYFARNN